MLSVGGLFDGRGLFAYRLPRAALRHAGLGEVDGSAAAWPSMSVASQTPAA